MDPSRVLLLGVTSMILGVWWFASDVRNNQSRPDIFSFMPPEDTFAFHRPRALIPLIFIIGGAAIAGSAILVMIGWLPDSWLDSVLNWLSPEGH
jgi:hypothetical protein